MNSIIQKIKNLLSASLSRFPEAFISIIIVGIISFGFSHDAFEGSEDIAIRLIMSGIIFFFFSTGIVLYKESLEKSSKLIRAFFALFSVFFAVLFFFTSGVNTDDIWLITFFLFTLVGVIALLFFAPYVNFSKKTGIKNTLYYSYFYSLSTAFFTATVVGILTFLLSAIGISTIDILFDLDYSASDTLYSDVAILTLVFLAPMYGLTQIPKKESFHRNSFQENIFFSLLIKYIALPFIILYFLILYVYTAKVLLNFGDWPRGEVSWMVIGFSFFGYLIYIFSYIYEKKHLFIKTLRKIFPYIIIPQVGMLFYALYLRIAQYDITTNRYFVLIFGVFLLLISLYLVFSKTKKLVFIPALLCIFTIIFSVGPWSIYNFPETRQFSRLENNLTQANILVNNKIISLEKYSDINPELSSEIHSGIEYLCNSDDCENIKQLFPEQYNKVVADYKTPENINNFNNSEEPYSYQIVEGITEQIQVRRLSPYSTYNDEYIYRNVGNIGGMYPLDIDEFDQLLQLQSNYDGVFDKNLIGVVNIKDETLLLREGDTVYETFALKDIFSELKNLESDFKEQVDCEEMTFDIEGEKYNIRLLIENFSLKKDTNLNQEQDNLRNENLRGFLLIKQK